MQWKQLYECANVNDMNVASFTSPMKSFSNDEKRRRRRRRRRREKKRKRVRERKITQ